MVSGGLANSGPDRRVRYGWVMGVVALYAAAFLVYAEKWAFTWDESYHLLASQSEDDGTQLRRGDELAQDVIFEAL